MAKQQIDVYRDWLGIKEPDRPLSYYQLLRLKPFQDSPEKVREHYRRMNTHVRKFAAGEYAVQSQQLLNELAKAMLCLTDAQRKREYDASLGRKDVTEGRRRSVEEILLANKVVAVEQVEKARNYANAIGLEIRDAILQQKAATPEAVWLAYAESVGLPYVELDDITVDETLVPQVPPMLARQNSFVPLMADRGHLLVASSNPVVPDVEDELRLRLGMPVRTVLCTPARINQAVAKYYPRDAVQMAPVAAAAPTAAPASAAAAAAPAEAPAPAKPLTAAEQTKRHGVIALVAFNITVVLYVLVQSLMEPLAGRFTPVAIVAVILGSVVAGIAFFAARFMKL